MGSSAVSKMSFTPNGTPCSGPCRRRGVGRPGAGEGVRGIERRPGLDQRLALVDAREAGADECFRGQRALGDTAGGLAGREACRVAGAIA